MIRDALEIAAARAYVAGGIDIGDIANLRDPKITSLPTTVRAAFSPPAVEYRPTGAKRAMDRDKTSVQFHYDISNEFYAIMLGPSMVYSCAEWDAAVTLEAAQRLKMIRILSQLGLRPEEVFLDIGAGWGSLVAEAKKLGALATGVTLSEQQVSEDVYLCDYRQLTGFENGVDKIASVGMIEHVGRERVMAFFNTIYELLVPGGMALIHGITKNDFVNQSKFIQRYVFPDGDILPADFIRMSAIDSSLTWLAERRISAGYPPTLRAWLANIDAQSDRCIELIGRERFRVWRLYLAASALQFERGKLDVHQFIFRKPQSSERG